MHGKVREGKVYELGLRSKSEMDSVSESHPRLNWGTFRFCEGPIAGNITVQGYIRMVTMCRVRSGGKRKLRKVYHLITGESCVVETR